MNGVPSCANKYLLTDLLRNAWGFDGYITSDCGAVADVYDQHHYTNTPDDTVNAVFSAGMDLNCGSFTSKYSVSAIQNGTMSENTLRASLYRAALVQFRLGLYDPQEWLPWRFVGNIILNSRVFEFVRCLCLYFQFGMKQICVF